MPSSSITADPARSWVEHLRRGGTDPWRTWRDRTAVGDRGPAPQVPGAQQLELLRRLNQIGAPSSALAERVLGASAPGRGLADLALDGAGAAPTFGPRPVDPADLPAWELVRVASGLIADDLVAEGVPDEPRKPPRPRRWRSGYRLVGDPVLAEASRSDLSAHGRAEGGRRPAILVLGTDLGQMLVNTWTARCLGTSAPSWHDWLHPVARGGALPPRIDLVAVADGWTDLVGPGRVRVVLDPHELARQVGVRRRLEPAPELSADAVELARRVGMVLGGLAGAELRAVLLRELLRPRLLSHPGPALTIPSALTETVESRAERMRSALVGSRYPVYGDPDALLAVARDGAVDPSDTGVLTLAMRLLLEKGSR